MCVLVCACYQLRNSFDHHSMRNSFELSVLAGDQFEYRFSCAAPMFLSHYSVHALSECNFVCVGALLCKLQAGMQQLTLCVCVCLTDMM